MKNRVKEIKRKVIYASISLAAASIIALSISVDAYAATLTKEFNYTQTDLGSATFVDLAFETETAEVTIVRTNDPDVFINATVEYESDPVKEPKFIVSKVLDWHTLKFKSENENEAAWVITIGPYDVDTRWTAVSGATVFDMELGGMPLVRLEGSLASSAMHLKFTQPTTRKLDYSFLALAGSEINIDNLGNADFDQLDISATSVKGNINYEGVYSGGQHIVNLVATAASFTMEAPSVVGENTMALSLLTTWNYTPFSDWWFSFFGRRTINYNSAADKINFYMVLTTCDMKFSRI